MKQGNNRLYIILQQLIDEIIVLNDRFSKYQIINIVRKAEKVGLTNLRPASLVGLSLFPNGRILGQEIEKLYELTPIALTLCMSCLYW